jgi:hypothetical protein
MNRHRQFAFTLALVYLAAAGGTAFGHAWGEDWWIAMAAYLGCAGISVVCYLFYALGKRAAKRGEG